jgi:hypothetical protein
MKATLKFVNQDATPKEQIIELASAASVDPVIQWYGGYFAGDDYEVFLNDRRIATDQNGEREAPLIHVVKK